MRSAVGSAVGSATDMARDASDALASAGTAVGEGLHEAGDRARRMAHDLRDAGSDAIGGVRHSAAGAGHQARDTFFDVLEREPLVIGAIGLAVGAAIGAFLPATAIEREHLGPTGEALKEKADALVDRGMAKAKEAVAEVYETARDAADRQGLLPGDTPVAEKVDGRGARGRRDGWRDRRAERAGFGFVRGGLRHELWFGLGSGSGSGMGTSWARAPAWARVQAPASAPERSLTPAPDFDSGMVSDPGPSKSGTGSATSP